MRFNQSKSAAKAALAEPWAFQLAKGYWLLKHSKGPSRQTLALRANLITAHLRFLAMSTQSAERSIGLHCCGWASMLTRLDVFSGVGFLGSEHVGSDPILEGGFEGGLFNFAVADKVQGSTSFGETDPH